MLNLENKTYVIMGIANKRSIAFGVAKVLDQLGAKLVFTYRKERSRKELEKLLEQLNQPEAHLYQLMFKAMKRLLMVLSKLVKMLAILMVYIIQSHLLIWKTYADAFLKLHVKASC